MKTYSAASVIELKNKPWIGKKKGMKGLPSETLKEGETQEDAARRSLDEELGVSWEGEIVILPDPLAGLPHDYEVHLAVVLIFDDEKPEIRPKDVTEVAFDGWLEIPKFSTLKNLPCGTRPETAPALAMFYEYLAEKGTLN